MSALTKAFAAYRAPFRVLDIPDNEPRAVYGCDLILLRPDMHIAWRGNRLPDEPPRDGGLTLPRSRTGHVDVRAAMTWSNAQ